MFPFRPDILHCGQRLSSLRRTLRHSYRLLRQSCPESLPDIPCPSGMPLRQFFQQQTRLLRLRKTMSFHPAAGRWKTPCPTVIQCRDNPHLLLKCCCHFPVRPKEDAVPDSIAELPASLLDLQSVPLPDTLRQCGMLYALTAIPPAKSDRNGRYNTP